jgi:hypothetical protein
VGATLELVLENKMWDDVGEKGTTGAKVKERFRQTITGFTKDLHKSELARVSDGDRVRPGDARCTQR